MAATLRHSGDLTTDADYIDDLRAAAEFIKSKLPPSDLAIVLGSGLQDFEKNLSDTSVVSYADIPGMPLPKVAGHPGRFISGVLPGGRRIYCLAGRSHCYEGYSFLTVAFPPNLLALLGVKIFVATNAAGGGPGTRVAKVEGEAEPVEQMHPGVLMLISDHVNNLLRNPIEEVSAVLDLSEPYLSGASLYSQRLRAIARTTYQQLNQPGSVSLYEGTYACFSGPTYETATEVTSASRSLGINAFGMSTVPDVILARACGLECLAISLVTNMAAGISGASLSHTEVTETGTSAANSFETYMSALLSAIPAQPVVPRDIPPPTAAQAMLTLPRALPRSATAAELGHAASQLRLGLGLATGDEPVVRSALFFGPPHSHPSLVVDADSPTVPVAQLRGFPVFSAAGRKGVVSLRREGGAATLLIDSRDHLGFCTAEANFLVAVLRLLGASHIALLVSAGSSEPTTVPVGSVVAITDYFDVATISAAPVSPHSPLPLVSDPTLPGHTCAFFPGPTYPSAAELAVASRAAITLSAVVHSHLISAAVAAALPLAVVATVDYLAPKAQDGLAAVSSDAATATALEHLRAQLAREQSAPPILDLTAASLADKYLTLGLHLSRPVTQGCLQAVAHDALAVRKALLLGDEDACPPVVLYDRGLPALSDLTILASYDFDLGEGVAADNATCRLSLAESAGHRWLLLQTAAPESSGVPLGTLMHPLRVVASLRPPSVLSVLRLFSTTELQRAQLVPLRDHVNRSGRNPLFGTNIAEWGERFFDVQTLYQSSLRQRLAAAIAKTVGSQPEDTVVCYGLGPFSISPAALRVLGIFTATAWAFSNIPEHLTLHHMGVPLAALGVVITSSDQVVNTQHLKSAITDFFFPTE